jgi:hypothetical protein
MSDYEEDSDDLIGYDDDNSGSYSTKLWTTRRTRTRAAALVAEYGMSGNASEEGGSSNFEDTIEDDDDVAGWGIEKKQPDNPLPGFIDPITLDEVVKPAISKYGHVMGYVSSVFRTTPHTFDNNVILRSKKKKNRYTSWVRCLTSWEGKRNICPLTKKPLTKRDVGKYCMLNWTEFWSGGGGGDSYRVRDRLLTTSWFTLSVILDFDNIEEYRLVMKLRWFITLLQPLVR